MNKLRLLLVEDDPNLGDVLSEYLDIKGYDTDLCRDGEEGWKAFKRKHYDMAILDVMMPKKDGFTLAREIREKDAELPMIFLTAKSMQEDAIAGLKIGADDYITKPFSMEELLLRIEAILRRSNTDGPLKSADQTYQLGKLQFDAGQQTVKAGDEVTKLTTKESQLLELLCQNAGKTLSRSHALNKIWGDDSYFNARSMDVYITKIRKVLKQDQSVRIVTVHGEGFRLITSDK